MNERTIIMLGIPNIGEVVSFKYTEEGQEPIYVSGRVKGIREGFRNRPEVLLDSNDYWFEFDENSLEVIK